MHLSQSNVDTAFVITIHPGVGGFRPVPDKHGSIQNAHLNALDLSYAIYRQSSIKLNSAPKSQQ